MIGRLLGSDTRRSVLNPAIRRATPRSTLGTLLHSGPISSVDSFGPYVATGGYDNRVILWDAATRQALAQGVHDHLVNHCAFSHDGRSLVTASSDYSARLWDIPSMRLRAVLAGHDDDVDMAAYSPDDRLVATCALDRKVRLFDVAGRCLETFHGHTGNIISLLWSPDGRRLVSSSVDGTVRQWDVAAGRQVSCTDLDAVRADSIAMDSHGHLFAGDDHGRIAVITDGGVAYVQGHRAGIKKIVHGSAGGILFSLSYDRTLAVWKIGAGGSLHEVARTSMPACIWARAAAVRDDGRLILGTFGNRYATYDWQQSRWDVADIGAGCGINAITLHQGSVYAVGDAGVVWKDGERHADMGSLCNFLLSSADRLYTGGQMGQLFDANTGEILHEHHSPLNCGTVLHRGGLPHVAIGSYTGEALVFAQPAAERISLDREIKVFGNAIKGMAARTDRMFSVCASTDVAWHDPTDLRLVDTVPRAHDKIANACSIAGDGGFASVGRDRVLRLWMNGVQEAYPSPHPNSVKCLCASPDGKRLMTGSYGGTLAGFDVPTRQWRVMSRPTTAGISAIAYDPGAQQFLAASYDGGIHVAQ